MFWTKFNLTLWLPDQMEHRSIFFIRYVDPYGNGVQLEVPGLFKYAKSETIGDKKQYTVLYLKHETQYHNTITISFALNDPVANTIRIFNNYGVEVIPIPSITLTSTLAPAQDLPDSSTNL